MDVQVFRDEYALEHCGVKVSVVKEFFDYDPRFSANGGSYYQPRFACSAPDYGTMEIRDESCGDFGSDIYVTVKYGDEVKYARYGSCADCAAFSDFTLQETPEIFWWSFAKNKLGYTIPTKEGL